MVAAAAPQLVTVPKLSMAAIPASVSSTALIAAAAAEEAKRASESAAAAAGLLGLSCAISARGEVRPSYPRPQRQKPISQGYILRHWHALGGADTPRDFAGATFSRGRLCFQLHTVERRTLTT